MRPLLHLLAALALATGVPASFSSATEAPPELSLRVMAYNIRYASTQPPNAWPDRRPAMKRLLDRESPDLIGTQEGVYAQVRDLAADLPEYEWIGLGREGGSRGEFMAVFYKRERFEPLAFDHFWLSDTPAVIGSFTWGNRLPRMVTWVRFRDRESGRTFEFWNTHFDHQSEPARQRSAELLRERLAKVDPALPIVLVGDFNALAGSSAAHATLTEGTGLVDTWTIAKERRNEGLNTYNNFAEGLREDRRIDWILASAPVVVDTAAIVDDAEDGVPPSDHYPVTAALRF